MKKISAHFAISLLLTFASFTAIAYGPIESLAREVMRATYAHQTGSHGGGKEVSYGGHTSVTHGYANPNCPQFITNGTPVSTDDRIGARSYYTCRAGYAGMYDPATKTPRWIAERLTRESLQGSANRKDIVFVEDPQLPRSVIATNDDFRRSGLDRGHLAASGDFRYSQEAMNQSFFLSNIVPQNRSQNRTVWGALEATVREMASRRGELFVITGPINGRSTIGNGVVVPDALFKVVIDPRRQEMTAFIIPNRDGMGADPTPYQVSVREVEKASGLNFNPALSQADSDRLEVGGGNWLIPKVRGKFND